MKNNFYNIPEDWYKDFNNTFNITNNMNNKQTSNLNLAEPKEAFLKGNLFNNLYTPYKNYKYGMISPNNQLEESLYNIMMYKFVLNELNLYLDIYPNNNQIINLYNKYLSEEKKLCEQFEKNYYLLTTGSKFIGENNWKWNKSPWPWEGTK